MAPATMDEAATSVSMHVGQGHAAGNVVAVVVTWQPDVPLLREALEAIATQVDHVVLVDNATRCSDFDALLSDAAAMGVEVIRSEGNLGLAAGFNRGIEQARKRAAAFVLLLDQDSVASPGMVQALVDGYSTLSASARVAAVGAQFVDPRDGQVAPFVLVGFPFNRKLQGGAGQRVGADFLISSGSLLPMAAIDAVGGMDESLFIDSVDLDWSFRARAAGFALYGICDARMRHSIGDALRPGLFGRKVFVHGPTRLYYLMRNRVLLYRRAHTPAVWVAQDVLRFVGKFVRMSMFVSPRRANARAMLRGLWDGIRGRAGKLAP
ncbi:MAG: glycosyltransferase family 2 protein [Luteimonas sp.]|nr:glycosyltransferase family 2 protein [Luteimonas sp.]